MTCKHISTTMDVKGFPVGEWPMMSWHEALHWSLGPADNLSGQEFVIQRSICCEMTDRSLGLQVAAIDLGYPVLPISLSSGAARVGSPVPMHILIPQRKKSSLLWQHRLPVPFVHAVFEEEITLNHRLAFEVCSNVIAQGIKLKKLSSSE